MNLKFVHDFEAELRVCKHGCCVMYEYPVLYILIFYHGIEGDHNLAALFITFLLYHER